MGRGQGEGASLLYGQPQRRRGDLLRGTTGKPALLPSLPGDGGAVTLERALVADMVRAYLGMGPEERRSRNVGVLRYLMHQIRPGFEQEKGSPRELEGRLASLTEEEDEVEVALTDAEWRSVYRVLQLAREQGGFLPETRSEAVMKSLFGLAPGDVDLEVECVRCGRDTGTHDACVVDGSWVGEVCCLGRATTVPAEAFPEDAVNFGPRPRAPKRRSDDRRHGRPRGSGTGRRPVGPGR